MNQIRTAYSLQDLHEVRIDNIDHLLEAWKILDNKRDYSSVGDTKQPGLLLGSDLRPNCSVGVCVARAQHVDDNLYCARLLPDRTVEDRTCRVLGRDTCSSPRKMCKRGVRVALWPSEVPRCLKFPTLLSF